MKYYKLIDGKQWGNGLKQGLIYPGNYKVNPSFTTDVEHYATNMYKKDWELSTKAAYNKQEGIITKPRVKKVVETISHEFQVGDKVEFIGNKVSKSNTYYADKTCVIGDIYTVNYVDKDHIKLEEDGMKFWLYKEHFKLSTQTELKQTQMENYSIEGSKALKTAFVEECKLTLNTSSTITGYKYLTSKDKPIGTVQGTGTKTSQHFVLPKDWDAAVKYVTEFNTAPKFKVNDWVVGWHCTYKTYKTIAWQIGKVTTGYISPKEETSGSTGINNVRFATPEEIKAAENPGYEMAGYNSKIDKSAKTISFGCQTYTKKEVKLLLDAANLCNKIGYSAKVKGNGFVVNDTDILTSDNLTKILGLLK